MLIFVSLLPPSTATTKNIPSLSLLCEARTVPDIVMLPVYGLMDRNSRLNGLYCHYNSHMPCLLETVYRNVIVYKKIMWMDELTDR